MSINDAFKKIQEKLKKSETPKVAPSSIKIKNDNHPSVPNSGAGPAPTFTPAGPLPSNPASPTYHQSGKPSLPQPHFPPKPQPYPTPPPKNETSKPKTEEQRNKNRNLVTIFLILAVIAGFMYRDKIIPIFEKYTKTSTSRPKKPKPLSYSKSEVIAIGPNKNNSSDSIKLPTHLKLKGTMVTGEKTVALINGNVQQVGDEIDGFKITDISIKKVRLMKDGQEFELSVKNEF